MKNSYAIYSFIVLFLGFSFQSKSQNESDFEIMKNIEIFRLKKIIISPM